MLDWDFARPGDPIEDLAWAAWRWAPLMVGTWWHAEYGITAYEDVLGHQQRNSAALLERYGPSDHQREILADAIYEQMTSHATDLEETALTDPAFANLIEGGFARAARDDARWWRNNAVRFDTT